MVVGYLAIRHPHPVVPRPTACVAVSKGQAVQLSVGQAGIAATIAGVADQRSMPARAVAIAYAAAFQESDMADLHYGDRDSVGVFQQRPSQGWGTTSEIENPVYASERFFAALAAVPDYLHMPIYQAAQAVQRSADGLAYSQYAVAGALLASAFTGDIPHAVWCSYGASVGKPRLLAAGQLLTSTFGRLSVRSVGDPALSVTVRSRRQGWAIAAWLVCHASTYGIRVVSYRGYEWLADHGLGRWVKRPHADRGPTDAGSAPADSTAVVFG